MQPIYPPRPKGSTSPGRLPQYEAQGGWVVQYKYNGDRIVIYISTDRAVKVWTRKGVRVTALDASASFARQIRSLDLKPGLDYWLDGEFLNARTTTTVYKNKVVLFDVLHVGRYLFNRPDLMTRYEMLRAICRYPDKPEPANGIGLVVTDDIWLAPTFTAGFKNRFSEKITMPEIEGLVLKRKASVLDFLPHSPQDVTWQVRCRKPNPDVGIEH